MAINGVNSNLIALGCTWISWVSCAWMVSLEAVTLGGALHVDHTEECVLIWNIGPCEARVDLDQIDQIVLIDGLWCLRILLGLTRS
jgi:hypothetical protein